MSVTLYLGAVGIIWPASKPVHILYLKPLHSRVRSQSSFICNQSIRQRFSQTGDVCRRRPGEEAAANSGEVLEMGPVEEAAANRGEIFRREAGEEAGGNCEAVVNPDAADPSTSALKEKRLKLIGEFKVLEGKGVSAANWTLG